MDISIKYLENDEHKNILQSPAQPLQFPLHQSAKKHIALLQQHHQKTRGVGLAAPQIGINEQCFIIEITDQQAALREHGTPFPATVFINPQYQAVADSKITRDIEACFSVKETAGWVPRYHRIQFNAFNLNGDAVSFIAEGFLARVLQHETDHCHGVLITDRLTDDCLQGTPEAMYAKRRQMLDDQQAQQLDTLRQSQHPQKD